MSAALATSEFASYAPATQVAIVVMTGIVVAVVVWCTSR